MKKLSPSKSKNKVKETINSMLNRRIVVSIILIFIYAFLLGIVGFEISTLLFLFSIMMFLKAGKWFKVLIISSVTLGVIIVIFSTIFNVILP
jgi:ABC-type multidrug transport system permease subunit